MSGAFRLLLISDTHGDVASIDEAIRAHGADGCIHCGDFGLYDGGSPERLTTRELRLRVRHSHVPRELRTLARRMSREEAIQVVREHGLMDGLVPYLDGRRSFAAPVWAVWGNHEDSEVVRGLQRGSLGAGNLFLLDERACFEPWPGVRIIGIGGNFLPDGDDFFSTDWTAPAGQILASWPQWARLLAAEAEREMVPWKILVTHVSPGKARLLERAALALDVWMSVSGHMGSPVPRNYSMFTIAEPAEALERSAAAVQALRSLWERGRSSLSVADRRLVEASIKRLDLPPIKPGVRPRGADWGYFRTSFLSLPDGARNATVLEFGEGSIVVTSRTVMEAAD